MESGLTLRDWDLLPTTELRLRLMTLPGVGEKIADCVLLFGFGRYEVFPIDVWVERVLAELYFARARNRKRERLRAFAWKYFGPYRGYAQQYLFHWIRTGPRGQRPSSPTRRPAHGPGTRRSKVPK